MQPLVSVVVPVFNGMPHLRAATESVLAQTYPNLEIVFSEGGGSDSSADYLATIDDPRVRVIRMPKGTSAAGNWTAVTNEAHGEFTKLLCQDDLLAPDAIAKQVADLQAHPSAVMAVGQRDVVDAKGDVLYAKRGLSGLKGDLMHGRDVIRAAYLLGGNPIGEPLAVLFRTDALKAAMPWRDDNPLMLDLSTYERIAPTGDVVLRHESIGAFRVSTSSWSTRLAKVQLEQTKQWQDEYAATARPTPSIVERLRATLGRHRQVNQRRAAYAVLRAKGSLHSQTETSREG